MIQRGFDSWCSDRSSRLDQMVVLLIQYLVSDCSQHQMLQRDIHMFIIESMARRDSCDHLAQSPL